jgi:hypothetical protein
VVGAIGCRTGIEYPTYPAVSDGLTAASCFQAVDYPAAVRVAPRQLLPGRWTAGSGRPPYRRTVGRPRSPSTVVVDRYSAAEEVLANRGPLD